MEEHLLEYLRMKGVYELRLQQEANTKLVQAAEAQAKEERRLREEEQQRREELERKLQKRTYEPIAKTGHVYVIETDGGIKVGKTIKDVSSRIKGMQTANRNDIKILLDFKTSNPDLLERVAHYILDRYRCNSNREFFDCDVEHIKRVVILAGNTIDTLKSMYESISEDEFIMRVNENVGVSVCLDLEVVQGPECDDGELTQFLETHCEVGNGYLVLQADFLASYLHIHPKADKKTVKDAMSK
ncbi:hypothetical protein HK102_010697, partial [Quaeritorhiza haematococci]